MQPYPLVGNQVYSAEHIQRGHEVAQAYCDGLGGWHEEIAKEAFNLIKPTLYTFPAQMVSNAAGRKRFLWQTVRKVLGKDTYNYGQLTGDCTSFSSKDCVEYLSCVEKSLGEQIAFKSVFPPFIYGVERTYVGKNQLRGQAGGTATWAAVAVRDYGVLFSDDEGVPKYSKQVADSWGDDHRYFDKFLPVAKDNPVKGVAYVRNWNDAVAAITNGYPCAIASNQGFAMKPDSNGFHQPQGNWSHAMCVIGIDDEWREPYVIILNPWGDLMGRLISFYDPNEEIPVGCLRVHKNVFEYMIQSGECISYSAFDGFPERSDSLDKSLFQLI